MEVNNVHTRMLKIRIKFLDLARAEEGQDIVEYILIFALLALGATTATHFLADGLAGAFDGISSTIGGYIS